MKVEKRISDYEVTVAKLQTKGEVRRVWLRELMSFRYHRCVHGNEFRPQLQYAA